MCEGDEEANAEDAGCLDAEAIWNKFGELQVDAVDDNEEEDIAAVSHETNDGVVRVTVDSGEERVAEAEQGSAKEES